MIFAIAGKNLLILRKITQVLGGHLPKAAQVKKRIKNRAQLPLAAFIRNRQLGVLGCLTFRKPKHAPGNHWFSEIQAYLNLSQKSRKVI
jgi:hypothetical protein